MLLPECHRAPGIISRIMISDVGGTWWVFRSHATGHCALSWPISSLDRNRVLCGRVVLRMFHPLKRTGKSFMKASNAAASARALAQPRP